MIERINIIDVDVLQTGVKLFANFSWSVGAGEHWVISGANGSGKTTLLEIIAGVKHVQQGVVQYSFVEGSTWDERYAERRKKIHYIPAHAMQSLINPDPTRYYQQRYYDLGDEQSPLVRDLLGDGVSRLRDLNIPESLSIEHLIDVEVTRLSNGQLKKVLLLKILLAEIPQFLLLDYPFEGLDHESRRDLCDFLDFMAASHSIQIIIVDNDHHLPAVMNRRLTLDAFTIVKAEILSVQAPEVPRKMTSTLSMPLETQRNAVVKIQNLRIKYGEKTILRDFNWTINQGDRWALVGRNGAGKTTLFSMIFADHPMAYSQEIYLFGKRRGSGESIWDIKRRIGYLGPELISYLAPGSILLSGGEYLRSINRKINEKKLGELIQHFHAENFVDKPVRVLSSGQLQLILIMNCFLTEKELLLLDEPFQFLDTRQRMLLKSYLEEHLHEETTLILITHYEQDLADLTVHRMRI